MIGRACMLILLVALTALEAHAGICGAHFVSPKIAIISGTDRSGSSTLKISRQVEELLKTKGREVSLLNLAEMDKSELNGDYFNPSAVFKEKFITKLEEADAVLFVFPEYYGDMPGVLKLFIDYLASASVFAGKPIGMVADSDGILGGQKGAETLSGIMRHRKADVIGESLVLIPDVNKKLQSDRLEDPALMQRLENSLDALVKRASLYQLGKTL